MDTIVESNKKSNEWESGPDELMLANSFYSNKLNIPVKLRSNEIDAKKYPVMSIYTVFKKTVNQQPNHHALVYKGDNSSYIYLTYNEYWKKCTTAAKSFIKVKSIS
jgi:hypothetical protein